MRLHPLLRELAREEWGQQPSDAQRAALAGLLAGVYSWVTIHHIDIEVLARDSDLIANTLRVAAAHQVELPLLLVILDALDNYLVFRDIFLGLELRTLGVQIAHILGDHHREVAMLFNGMQLNKWLGDPMAEVRLLHEAQHLVGDVSDQVLRIRVLCAGVAYDLAHGGSPSEAREKYEEARAIARTLDVHTTPVSVVYNLGDFASMLGDLEDGKDLMEQALVRSQAANNHGRSLICLHNLGNINALLGDDAAACTYHGQELALGIAYGGTDDLLGITCDMLGEIRLRAGDLEAASRYFYQALQSDEAVNDLHLLQHYRANLLVVQGEVARLHGKSPEAQQCYQEALTIFEPAPTPYNHYAREYITFVQTRIAMLTQQLTHHVVPNIL